MSAEPGIFVHQFELGPWDNFIYLSGDKATRRCAVIAPAWDAQLILAEAERLGISATGNPHVPRSQLRARGRKRKSEEIDLSRRAEPRARAVVPSSRIASC